MLSVDSGLQGANVGYRSVQHSFKQPALLALHSHVQDLVMITNCCSDLQVITLTGENIIQIG